MSSSEIPRWRKEAGEGHFVEALVDAQKDGAKLASKDRENPLRGDKSAHFELTSSKAASDTVAITAPFFGPHAEGKELPPFAYLDDYEEFFRAYQAAFIYWLRERGPSGSKKKSLTAFGKLVQQHATRPRGTPLHEVALDVYGLPLSHEDGSIESLEWRFLAWLAKGGR